MGEFTVERAGVTLAGEEHGEGIPVVLLHGLTATRRYVVMGSRSLERSGHRVVAYDALDHGNRVGGLVVVTPAFEPDDGQDEAQRLARWDALAEGLREGGVEGFVA